MTVVHTVVHGTLTAWRIWRIHAEVPHPCDPSWAYLWVEADEEGGWVACDAHGTDPPRVSVAPLGFAQEHWGDVPWEPHLRSVVIRTRWPTGRPMEAGGTHRLAVGERWKGDCPHLDVACGIHALRDPVRLLNTPGMPHDPDHYTQGWAVVGQVALWGRVFEHEEGWRAQYARPLTIVRMWDEEEPDVVRRVRNRYALPLIEHEPVLQAKRYWEKGGYIVRAG